MFGTIRKHQTWLWAVIITLTIISFVIFFSPYAQVDNNTRGVGDLGTINGVKVTEQQVRDAMREVSLHYFMMNGGRWPDEDRDQRFDVEREAYNWLVLARKQRELGIHASDEATARTAQQMSMAFERAGVTSPTVLVEKVLRPKGLGWADFERYVRHYIGLQELITTFGVTGKLVTPEQARTFFARDHEEVIAQVVLISASNYLSSVTIDPEALAQFYSNRMSQYRLPERVQVNYVKFNVTNYLQEAEDAVSTNLAEIVEANYQRMGTNVFPDATTPEEVKARIRQEVIRQQALEVLARRKAMDFATLLFEMQPAQSQNLETLAGTNGLVVSQTAPFDREETPADLPVALDFTKTAFELTAEEPFGTPVKGRDGFYVIALGRTLPSEVPPLEQIRDQVTADFRFSQAAMQARLMAALTMGTITNGLAQGKSFSNICVQASLNVVSLPPFSLSTRELPAQYAQVNLNDLKQAAFSTAPGKVSGFMPNRQGGMILYVESKLPVGEARLAAELPAYVESLRRTRQQEAFNAWLRRELEEGLRDTPPARRQQQQQLQQPAPAPASS